MTPKGSVPFLLETLAAKKAAEDANFTATDWGAEVKKRFEIERVRRSWLKSRAAES